ncbi:MAG: hypothetical protein ACM3JJ_04045, partial [Hyphomicrobiales bacterium]
MPGDYAYLDGSDLYVTTYWGRLSLLDILETISQRMKDPDLREAKLHVIDLSNATWTEAPATLVHDQLDRLRPAFAPPKIPTVLVAPSEFFFGFARMYAVFQVTYGGSKVDVARSWSEAASRTGVALEEAQAWSNRHASGGSADESTRIVP